MRKKYPNDFDDFCIKTPFYKLCITKKNYQTVEKKQLLIVLPIFGSLSFETRNRLNSCIKNQLRFCSLRIAFQPKTHLSRLHLKTVFPTILTHILFINFCVVVATQLIMVKLRDTFLYQRRSIWQSLHSHKNVLKISKILLLWAIFY